MYTRILVESAFVKNHTLMELAGYLALSAPKWHIKLPPLLSQCCCNLRAQRDGGSGRRQRSIGICIVLISQRIPNV